MGWIAHRVKRTICLKRQKTVYLRHGIRHRRVKWTAFAIKAEYGLIANRVKRAICLRRQKTVYPRSNGI